MKTRIENLRLRLSYIKEVIRAILIRIATYIWNHHEVLEALVWIERIVKSVRALNIAHMKTTWSKLLIFVMKGIKTATFNFILLL
jgi:uncharacterized protein YpiB (UPF0302 family)